MTDVEELLFRQVRSLLEGGPIIVYGRRAEKSRTGAWCVVCGEWIPPLYPHLAVEGGSAHRDCGSVL